jgi:gliding motility-associated-like protein
VSATLNNGTGVVWVWTHDGSVMQGANASTINVDQNGAYVATGTNAEGCSATSDPVNITFTEPFTVNIIQSDDTPCVGESITLSVDGAFPHLLWSNGSTASTITVTTSATYNVVASDDAGCSASDDLILNFNPIPFVSAGIDTVADCTVGVVLNGIGSGNVLWSPTDGLSDATILNPVAKPALTTTYTLTATLNGCSATSSVVVEADCESAFVPNTFTPNGDGHSDTFKVTLHGVSEFELRIYNRWGTLMYQSNDANDGWTGSYNGVDQSDGTYYYTLVAKDRNGHSLISESQQSGYITMLR